MLNIIGKTLVTTDWHFGLKNNQESRILQLTKAIVEMNRYIRENDIKNLIFCGDMFHNRDVLSINTINYAVKMINKLSETCKLYLIVGNHDMFLRNTTDVNSMIIFKNTKNVVIIDKMTEANLNGQDILLCPWLSDVKTFGNSKFDMMFGHFDIDSAYLAAAYFEENKTIKKTSEDLTKALEDESLLREAGLTDLDFDIENVKDTIINHKPASTYVGNWTEVAKEGGVIFSGHIHQHREFYVNRRRFIFVGSPYQQTKAEMKSIDGFYVLSEENDIKFIPLTTVPKIIGIKISDILKIGIDKFDFSIVNKNIIYRIYDQEIDYALETKIMQKITMNKPFEELPQVNDIDLNYVNRNGEVMSESLEKIRESRWEFLEGYVNTIDQKSMENENIDKTKLLKILNEYYLIATEGN